MRAVVVNEYGPVEVLAISEAPRPVPGSGEVLIRVVGLGVGFVDALKVQGKYQTKDPLPFIPGSEVSGVVDQLGEGVTGLQVGDRVTAQVSRGGLAEYVAAPVAAVSPLPEGISFEIGAAIRVNYLTALYALAERGAAKQGETLLVLGASGGTGTAAIAVGKLLGLTVVAAASTEEKRKFALQAGADDAIDSSDSGWRAALKESHPQIDLIFDPVGGDLGAEAFRALGWKGRLLVIGFASGEIPSARYNIALLKGASLVGVDIAQVPRRDPEIWTRINRQLVDWLSSGALDPAIDEAVPLDRAAEAFTRMTGRAAMGKVVVRIAEDV